MSRVLARAAWVAYFTVALSLVVIPVANAYLDPGTGSMIFQAVIAAAMAVGLSVKIFWRRITSAFRADAHDPQDEE